MGRHRTKTDRQKNSRARLGDSIFRIIHEITDVEKLLKSNFHVIEYEKLKDLHYKLGQNLKEYIHVDELIKQEEVYQSKILNGNK